MGELSKLLPGDAVDEVRRHNDTLGTRDGVS